VFGLFSTCCFLIPAPRIDLALWSQNISSTSIVVTLYFKFVPVYSGTLYCLAKASSYNVTTFNKELYIYGSSASYTGGVSIGPHYVFVTQLQSLTVYNLTCGVWSSTGAMSYSWDITSSRHEVETSCCKAMSWTSTTSLIYNTSSLYLSGSMVTPTFSFVLSSPPSTSLIITPIMLLSTNSNTSYSNGNGLIISPSTIFFFFNSTILSKSFSILPSSIPSGTYTLRLYLSSSSSNEFDTLTTSVIVSTLTSIPAPQLKSARFANSGNGLLISFDTDTNYASLSTSSAWNCSLLFTFVSSSQSSCSWLTKAIISVVFSSTTSTMIDIGNSVALKGDCIKSTCFKQGSVTCLQSDYASKQTVYVETASNAITPSVLLQVPSSISGCSSILVNPSGCSGNGGRDWKSIRWLVSGSDETSSALIQSTLYEYANKSTDTTIVILSSSVVSGTYSITLTLKNFLGQSASTSTVFAFGLDSNIPQMRIVGSKKLTKKPSQTISLTAFTELSSCAQSNVSVSYSWITYQDGSLTSLLSSSKSPLVYALPAYSLTAGSIYEVKIMGSAWNSAGTARINSTASVFITVTSGSIISQIKGGSVRWLSADTTLDGSGSYDEDSNDASLLQYEWSCLFINALDYGSSCTSTIFDSSTSLSSSNLKISYAMLNSTKLYQISLVVSTSTSTKRYGQSFVSIRQQTSTISASVSISSTATVINKDSQMTLVSAGDGSQSLFMTWSAYVNDQAFSLNNSALTPLQRNFTSSQMIGSISYPLVLSANTFSGGVSVTFRISASYQSSSSSSSKRRQLTGTTTELTLISYSEITFRVNEPPSSGIMTIIPANGTALTTNFAFSTSGWIDDATDLPFTYDFRNALTLATIATTSSFIKSRTEDNAATSLLAAGLQSNDRRIYIVIRAYDIYLASSTISSTVVVGPLSATNVDYSSILTSSLSAALSVQNVDGLVSVINMVSSSMNSVNCSLVGHEFCFNRNRDDCSTTANTCGSCLSGFVGIDGDSNTKCVEPTSIGAVGDLCTSDNDCLYNSCDSNKAICTAPIQTCPSQDPNVECSGHGTCAYEVSGKTIDASSCTILNVYCTVSCVCNSGFGGSSCQLSSEQLLIQQTARVSMCGYLGNVTNMQDPSSSLVDSLSGSLLATYSPYEVFSETSISACADSLSSILSVATSGSMDISSPSSYSNFGSTISNFVKPGNSTFLNNATSSLAESVLQQMSGGQSSISFAASNLKMIFTRTLTSDLSNSSTSVPQTTKEQSYGALPMSVRLMDAAASACDDGTGYSSMAVGGWTSSPFANSTELRSGVLRTQSFASSTISSSSSSLSSSVAFYMSIPFVQTETFVEPTEEEKLTATSLNYTFPTCTQYGADATTTKSCANCNVSSYTNTSVIFACYDIADICSNGQRRRLDLSLMATDSSSGSSLTGLLFQSAALMGSLSTVFARTVSFNIFSIDLNKAKTALSLVGFLLLSFLSGLVLFYRWDRWDRNLIVYRDQDVDTESKRRYLQKVQSMGHKSQEIKRNQELISCKLSSTNPVDVIPLTVDEDNYISPKNSKSLLRNLLHHIDEAVPIKSLLSKNSNKQFSFHEQVWQPLLNYHDYAVMFGYRSLSTTRLIRWINLCLQVYFTLFVDTLFFSVFFADTGTCELFLSESNCLASINSITAQPTCQWSTSTVLSTTGAFVSNACSLNPPPSSMLFTIMLSAVTMLITVPLGFFFDYVRIEICSKRPDVTRLQWDNLFWLGTAVYSTGVTNSDDNNSTCGEVDTDMKESTTDTNSSFVFTEFDGHSRAWEELLNLRTGALNYSDLLTIDEECLTLLQQIQSFYSVPSHRIKPQKQRSLFPFSSTDAKILAIQQQFGLTANDFTNGQQSVKVLQNKLKNSTQLCKTILQARRESLSLSNRLFSGELEEIATINRNVELLQMFMLEQLPPFQRFALKYQCFAYPTLSPEVIDPSLWFAGWVFLIGSCLFFLYWMLNWSLSSGTTTLRAWGINFVISIIQDVLLIQVFRVYFIYIATSSAITPHIDAIYKTLRRVAFLMYSPSTKISTEHQHEQQEGGQSVAQHELPIDALRVVQYSSATCRLARKRQLLRLPASKLLRCLDDYDVSLCRYQSYSTQLGMFTVLVLFAPVVLTPVNEQLASSVFETLFPTVISSIFVSFCLLLSYSIYVFIGIVLIVAAIFALRSLATYVYVSTITHVDRDNLRRLWSSFQKQEEMKTLSFSNIEHMDSAHLWKQQRSIHNDLDRTRWQRLRTTVNQVKVVFSTWIAHFNGVSITPLLVNADHTHQWCRMNHSCSCAATMCVSQSQLRALVELQQSNAVLFESLVANIETAFPTMKSLGGANAKSEYQDCHDDHQRSSVDDSMTMKVFNRQLGLTASPNETMKLILAMAPDSSSPVRSPALFPEQPSTAQRYKIYVEALVGTDSTPHRKALLHDLFNRQSSNMADCLVRTLLIHYRELHIPNVNWYNMTSSKNMIVLDDNDHTTHASPVDNNKEVQEQLLAFVLAMDKYCREIVRTTFPTFRETNKMKVAWEKYAGATFSLMLSSKQLLETWTSLLFRPTHAAFSVDECEELMISFEEYFMELHKNTLLTRDKDQFPNSDIANLDEIMVPVEQFLFWSERSSRLIKRMDE
jgi:hypothetical protein